MNTKFLQHKLKREIRRSGKEFIFYKYPQDNNFGEEPKITELVEVKKIKGLFHKKNAFIASYSEGYSNARTEMQNMLMIPYDEALVDGKYNIESFAFVSNDKKDKFYKFSGASNIQELDLILDLSLEPVDLGNVVV